LQTIESTIKTITATPWLEELARKHPIPPTYIAEVNGKLSVSDEKFDCDLLTTRLEETLEEMGTDSDTSKYTERDESGEIRSGWLIAFSTLWERIQDEVLETRMRIFEDGSFYIKVYYPDILRLYPYYDFEKHNRIIEDGQSKVPFFFIQTIVYNRVFLLHLCAHTLWGKRLEIALEPPKVKYNWIERREKEVNVRPIWIKELREISWVTASKQGEHAYSEVEKAAAKEH